MPLIINREILLSLRNAKPLPAYADFMHVAPDESFTLDFDNRERGYWTRGLWESLADTVQFDQQLDLGFSTEPIDELQLHPIAMSPAIRGRWISGIESRPIIAIGQLDVNGRPGWYTTFGFFLQDRDGLVYDLDETTVIGSGIWVHPY